MQDKRKLAIEVDNVQKIYKLYDKPSDRLKEAFGFGKKTKHKLHYALKGVSMKIYQGETVGIIGTNGSGKSYAFSFINIKIYIMKCIMLFIKFLSGKPQRFFQSVRRLII